jgi:hemerythrin superfamily protein
MAKQVKQKDKEQLDLMTKDQIMEYRSGYLSQRDINVQYYKELELYINIRFKEDVIARFLRWNNLKDDPKTYKDDRDAMKLVCEIIYKMGMEEYYKWTINGDKENIGQPQFIKE